jgi:two-component system chemotaxis response regulator CheB
MHRDELLLDASQAISSQTIDDVIARIHFHLNVRWLTRGGLCKLPDMHVSASSGPTDATPDRSCVQAVAIVASAGGIEALFQLLSALPRDFEPPIIVAQHLARNAASMLADVLRWRAGVHACWAEEGRRPRRRTVHIVPPGTSMAVTPQGFSLTKLAPVSASWLTAPDRLLTSLASTYRSGAVAVFLSGMLPVGLEGLKSIRSAGGTVMAQNESSSSFFDMPAAAADFGKAEIRMAPHQLADALEILVAMKAPAPRSQAATQQ